MTAVPIPDTDITYEGNAGYNIRVANNKNDCVIRLAAQSLFVLIEGGSVESVT